MPLEIEPNMVNMYHALSIIKLSDQEVATVLDAVSEQQLNDAFAVARSDISKIFMLRSETQDRINSAKNPNAALSEEIQRQLESFENLDADIKQKIKENVKKIGIFSNVVNASLDMKDTKKIQADFKNGLSLMALSYVLIQAINLISKTFPAYGHYIAMPSTPTLAAAVTLGPMSLLALGVGAFTIGYGAYCWSQGKTTNPELKNALASIDKKLNTISPDVEKSLEDDYDKHKVKINKPRKA